MAVIIAVSAAVGKIIQKVAADSMKRVTLELGGKNACIVLDDADVDTAVRIASGGNFFNSGQICVSQGDTSTHIACWAAARRSSHFAEPSLFAAIANPAPLSLWPSQPVF